MDHGMLMLVARFCLGAVYLYSSIDKIVNWPKALAFCADLRLPRPELVLAATIALQLAAGLMLLSGWHARVAAVALGAFTVVATCAAHNPFGRPRDEFRREVMLSLEHLAIIGGLLLIAVDGPGPLALLP